MQLSIAMCFHVYFMCRGYKDMYKIKHLYLLNTQSRITTPIKNESIKYEYTENMSPILSVLKIVCRCGHTHTLISMTYPNTCNYSCPSPRLKYPAWKKCPRSCKSQDERLTRPCPPSSKSGKSRAGPRNEVDPLNWI